MRPFKYSRAEAPEDAIEKRRAGAAFLAGGTTLIDLIKLDVMRPEQVVDVSRLPLNAIEPLPGGGLSIGANVRNSDLAWNDDVKNRFPLLSQAVLSGASPQLRNMATTAGNLMQRTRCPYFRDNYSDCNKRVPGSGCAAMEGYNRMHAVLGGSSSCVATHPSDMCVALLALDATVVVEGTDGERRIPLEDFHLLPGESPEKEHALREGELITGVEIPATPAESRSVYLKSRDRESFEFALASAAALVTMRGGRISEARIALGGVATKPWRCPEAEARLRDEAPSEELFAEAAQIALRDARPLEHNAFKIPLAMGVLRRALAQVIQSAANPEGESQPV